VLSLVVQQSAAADILNPFEVDVSDWVSLNRYTDRENRFPSLCDATQEETALPPAPTSEDKPALDDEPKMAQPSRPLILPVMPGLNKDFDFLINSTAEAEADEDTFPKADRPLNLSVMPGMRQGDAKLAFLNGGDDKKTAVAPPQDELWKDMKSFAREAARSASPRVPVPFNVRLAILPDPQVTAVLGEPVVRPRKKPPEAVPGKTMPKDDKIAQRNAAAWEALNAFRKQQLEAIESDRQTLNALQDAIAELGLDKKLDFVAGASTHMTTLSDDQEALPPADDAAPEKRDIPLPENTQARNK
jgi:hypothetical protein